LVRTSLVNARQDVCSTAEEIAETVDLRAATIAQGLKPPIYVQRLAAPFGFAQGRL